MRYLKDSPKTALIYGERRVDYHHLLLNIVAFSAYSGAGAGERVAIVMENCPEWPTAFLSAWQAGQIPVPMDTQCTPDELAFMMRDADVKAVWCSAKTADDSL